MTMIHRNRRAIHLNNVAVDQFESGLLVNAYQALIEATALLSADTEERQEQQTEDAYRGMYRYFWVECSSTYNRPKEEKKNELCLNEGISSFLCLRALKVTINPQDLEKLDSVCDRGYSWVIWYNLALVSNLMGTRLGEKGYNLLGKAFDLLQKVQTRINSESATCDWSFLQMAIINNQACIYRELAMMDALHQSLDKLSESLSCQSTSVVGKQHRDTFYFNFVVLSGQTFAPAA
ncbi:unnamed protein product [Cylindrotheca closterium]|uniref:Uncharacterized protein n=1 Tax=Cylindrotheca closterium TaxID=2856 RepID=A0AAD2FMN7_9STRA|nr:unnamed protein product [Cylindrotheca closterium]